MRKSGNAFIGAVVAVVLATLALPASAPAQPAPTAQSEEARQNELDAAYRASEQAGTAGPADITLIDQAVFKLPDGFFFIPKAEGARMLRALGNAVSDSDPTFVGLVVGTKASDQWIVVTRFIKEGYIKDDDAKEWNADELLQNLKDGTAESNKDRVARGFPELEVLGWVEKPIYDSTTHRLVAARQPKGRTGFRRKIHQLQHLRAGSRWLFQPQSADQFEPGRRRQECR